MMAGVIIPKYQFLQGINELVGIHDPVSDHFNVNKLAHIQSGTIHETEFRANKPFVRAAFLIRNIKKLDNRTCVNNLFGLPEIGLNSQIGYPSMYLPFPVIVPAV